MKYIQFVHEEAHPENPHVTLRFFVTAPYPPALGLKPGQVLEAHVFWEGDGPSRRPCNG